MAKTRQPELILQPKIITSLHKQGFLALKSSDRFKAGRPDLRTGRKDLGQIDFELKYCTEPMSNLWFEPGKPREFDTGLRLLQQLKMGEMNEHGMLACGLIYVEAMERFFVTLLLRDVLPPLTRCVLRGNSDDDIIDGEALYAATKGYLDEFFN